MQALVGEIMMSRARAMGVAGFVIDGAIRDVAAFRSPTSLLCAWRHHRGPYKCGPGEINVPAAIDGMVVMPGDVVVGDADGVVTFDRADAAELLALVRQQEAREAALSRRSPRPLRQPLHRAPLRQRPDERRDRALGPDQAD